MAKAVRASAGSFLLGTTKREPTRSVTTYIHNGGRASCGGGHALSAEEIEKTAEHVSAFVQKLGWGENAANAVKAQLRVMPLSEDPKRHAEQLHNYYHRSFGIGKHRAIVEDLETGKRKTVVQKGKWFDFIWGDNVACADARHIVHGKPRIQTEQTPKGFYFGEKPFRKSKYNETFTIAGISPEEIRSLLEKSKNGEMLTPWEAHNVAAVTLSVYYYSHHKWPEYEKLEAMIRK